MKWSMARAAIRSGSLCRHRILYTTNAIEALKLRRAVRAREHFRGDEAATNSSSWS
jgi:transposase-like protein